MTEAVMPFFIISRFLCDPLQPSRFPGKSDRLGQDELVVGDIVAYVVHALQTAAVPAVVGEARRIEHGDGEPAVVDIRAVLRDEPGGAPGEITLGGVRTVDQHRLVVAHEGQPSSPSNAISLMLE